MPKTKIDYSNGKIYKIINDTSDMVYIGSTCSILRQRFHAHKRIYKSHCDGNYKKVPSNSRYIFDDNIETSKIILLESYSCNSKDELLLKEREWLEKYIEMGKNVVNCYKPILTTEEKKEYKVSHSKGVFSPPTYIGKSFRVKGGVYKSYK